MAIGGSKRHGYIDGSIKEPAEEDPKYQDWVSENIFDWLSDNMLGMNWILNSMEEGIAGSFKHSDTTKELWASIEQHMLRKEIKRVYLD